MLLFSFTPITLKNRSERFRESTFPIEYALKTLFKKWTRNSKKIVFFPHRESTQWEALNKIISQTSQRGTVKVDKLHLSLKTQHEWLEDDFRLQLVKWNHLIEWSSCLPLPAEVDLYVHSVQLQKRREGIYEFKRRTFPVNIKIMG